MQRSCQKLSSNCVYNRSFTYVVADDLTAVIDGCPMKKGDSLTIWLIDIVSSFNEFTATGK